MKDLWHQIPFVTPAWSRVLEATADETHRLGAILGDAQDLTVLRTVVVAELDEPTIADLVRMIDGRRAGLYSEAHGIGATIYVEAAKVFVRRLGGYWRAWRVED